MAELHDVRITKDAVYVGGQKLPDWIEEDGVVVRPGGVKSFNRLEVTFIVGDVVAENTLDG